MSVGVADVDNLKQTLNRNYLDLYLEYDWPHLRMVFDKIPLQAGERFYDLPDGLNLDRVEEVVVWYSGLSHPLIRGIDFADYNGFDSQLDYRSEPALKWDARWTGTKTQVEIWPVPYSNDQTIQFKGFVNAPRLVNDEDVCLLDDNLVVLFSAHELLQGQKGADAETKLAKARERLNRLKGRSQGGSEKRRLGLGPVARYVSGRAIVRVR
ncbi:hypothetical protein [Rhodoligotrophos defluvii]|uniref:phage adaptor protein n=1 Tax=Rhodoligotrophos defluvii TaxID=2561934 RepID=UPI0010CA1943|nr:hypothetical protein [Rhodoligotrophos defluvii]